MSEYTLHQIRSTILDTLSEGWHRIDAPTFRADFEWGSDGVTAAPTHSRRVVLRDDVRIALEWGFDVWGTSRRQDGPYAEPWVTDKFASPSARLFYADVLFLGSIVDRVSLVAVDGERAYIPQPSVDSRGDGDYDYVVGHWEYHFAALLNDLDGSGEVFERYFAQTDIEKDF